MLPNCRKALALTLTVFLLPAVISAGPKIEVDTTDYDIGTVWDGKIDTFKYTFKIKNTGNAPLRISQVRKTCECTSVSFDSIIQPGSASAITEVISTEKASPGKFTIPITVLSDARNSPILKLSIRGIFKLLVETDPTTLTLISKKGQDTGTILTLKTAQKGFKVTGVSFSFTERNTAVSWQASIPMDYSFAPADSIKGKQNIAGSVKLKKDTLKQNGSIVYIYKLKIMLSKPEQTTRSGEFFIRTNLTEKPEIRVFGNLVVD